MERCLQGRLEANKREEIERWRDEKGISDEPPIAVLCLFTRPSQTLPILFLRRGFCHDANAAFAISAFQ